MLLYVDASLLCYRHKINKIYCRDLSVCKLIILSKYSKIENMGMENVILGITCKIKT